MRFRLTAADRRLRTGLGALAAGALVILSAACSSGASPGEAAVPAGQPSATAVPRTDRQYRMPGVSGSIAEIDGKTLQVQGRSEQGQEEQTAVSYTPRTAISRIANGARSDLSIGRCVTVISSRPQTSATPPTKITAASVAITPARNGSCAAGTQGRPAGTQPGGGSFPGGTRPTARPSMMRSGRPMNVGQIVAGQIRSVTGSGMIITGHTRASAATTSVPVTLGKQTTYTLEQSADASAIKVGRCVTAIGRTDDTGAVRATRLTVFSRSSGRCTVRFGAFGPGAGTGRAPAGGQLHG